MARTVVQSTIRAVGQRVPGDIGPRIGAVVLSSVDQAIDKKWADAQRRAVSITGDSIDAKITALGKSFAQELGTVGAVTGAAAAVPAAGTATAIAVGIAELGWFTMRSSELILTIAALHGHTQSTVEERRAWILSVLAFGNGATEAFTKLAGEVGKGLGQQATRKIPIATLRRINSGIGRTIVTKYGTKRGVVALGTALPFGFGAAIGGTTNYAGVRLLTRHTNKFFKNLPYASVEPDPA